jgi:hypothetical protein
MQGMRNRTRASWIRTALLAAVAACALAPATAGAGTYTVYNCQDPTGAPASTSAWSTTFTDPSKQTTDSSCPRGGIHIAFQPGQVQAPNADARLYFWAPDNTEIISYSLWRSVVVGTGSAYYFSPMERYGTDWRWAGTGCGGTSCSGLGNPSVPLDPTNRWDRKPPTPITGVMLYISCSYDNSGTTTCPATHPEVEAWLHRSDITLADDLAPTFSTAPTGALVAATAPVSGVTQVSVQAADKGGGLAAAQVEVDGRVVATQPLGASSTCQQPYTARVPCPLVGSATVPVDTTTLADGTHSVRVLLRDAAGNVTATTPVTATTANAPPDASCDPTPVGTSPLRFSAGIVHQKRGHGASRSTAQLTVHYNTSEQLRFSGQLSDAAGNAVPSAPVCIVSRAAGIGGPLLPLARVTTGADGRFTVPLARGSSRELVAIYRVDGGALTGRATLRVIPHVTLHPSRSSLRNGQLLRFKGTVSGGPIPSRGVLVQVEAWDGTGWSLVRQAHAKGAAGRFQVSHRFRYTTGTQRYTFRAHIVTQAAYPYLAGVSSRIHVRVHG